jgi:hypothetical protein
MSRRLLPVDETAQLARIDVIPLIIVQRGGQAAFGNGVAQLANGECLALRVILHRKVPPLQIVDLPGKSQKPGSDGRRVGLKTLYHAFRQVLCQFSGRMGGI